MSSLDAVKRSIFIDYRGGGFVCLFFKLYKSELLYIGDKISYNDIKYYFAFLQKDRESGVWRMKVLLSNVSRKNGYMIIDVFFSVLSGMNYPVLAHDDTMLKFIDVDEKFKKTEIRYDFRTLKIIMG